MVCGPAEAEGFGCVDVYHLFNGPHATEPAGDLLARDYTHPSQQGNDKIAGLLLDLAPTVPTLETWGGGWPPDRVSRLPMAPGPALSLGVLRSMTAAVGEPADLAVDHRHVERARLRRAVAVTGH